MTHNLIIQRNYWHISQHYTSVLKRAHWSCSAISTIHEYDTSSKSEVLKPCQGPPKLHVFGHRPTSWKISFQGRPEAEISVTKVYFEKYIFKKIWTNVYVFSKIADLGFRRHS